MALTFKNRIALQYMLATAALVAVAYALVFLVVRQQVYAGLDARLRFEATKHSQELSIVGHTIHFAHRDEWEEREHREVDVDPIFLQINDLHGHLLDRSPNLKADELVFDPKQAQQRLLNLELRGKAVRQAQETILRDGQPVGYVVAAISSEDAQHVLSSLGIVLLLSFPVVLLGLYASARLLAGRSIAPVAQITATTNRITRSNLAERIALPARPDELHTLATAINGLLARIEQAVEREKQFTADASHELRTPLAVLKGTLEVLVRKPRTAPEYVESIKLSIQEIDRLTNLVDQLLLLARFDDSGKMTLRRQELSVLSSVHDVLYRLRTDLGTKRIRVDVQDLATQAVASDPFMVDLILDNVLSNAVKYSPAGSTIVIELADVAGGLRCSITDAGIGIRADDLPRIFDPLYRSDALAHKHIGGTGLGLSIVAKACALLGIQLSVDSTLGQGTTFTLLFPA
ncbi:sensor histidine kinase [Hymenobacter wooponensis]|uniref:histidine kinase n=1 Tax=Hymenobacter wooponensis TaxID=1525360 RepID=A0A4Z0MHY7_9BACT|nr:ATP-binding protein [Hymenobacter wooponensis]TGD78805.1 HAMP domain-containing protein [Hymenobacter wooponensis]